MSYGGDRERLELHDSMNDESLWKTIPLGILQSLGMLGGLFVLLLAATLIGWLLAWIL